MDNSRGPGVPDGWVAEVFSEANDGERPVDSFCWHETEDGAVAAARAEYPDAEG